MALKEPQAVANRYPTPMGPGILLSRGYRPKRASGHERSVNPVSRDGLRSDGGARGALSS